MRSLCAFYQQRFQQGLRVSSPRLLVVPTVVLLLVVLVAVLVAVLVVVVLPDHGVHPAAGGPGAVGGMEVAGVPARRIAEADTALRIQKYSRRWRSLAPS